MSKSLRGKMRAVSMGLSIALAFSTLMVAPAEARLHHRRHHGGGGGYTPPFAAMVVDANSGHILYAKNANDLRHPASLTKVMTLYLLFQEMEKGRFSLGSELKVSAHAAAQSPSKLGLTPGDTITVEEAIKAIVTKSANDVAVTIAENIGGSEPAFADMMTRKARELGMTRTVYRNASGLPNSEQVTTARDLTLLGRAIQDRFPKYYHYFSTHEFDFAGRTILNHNRLIGHVEGVDGIKTGFTNASGFNLLSSIKRDGHWLVASVLGGRSGPERDRIMTGLLEDHLDEGATRRTAALITDRPSAQPIKVAAESSSNLRMQDKAVSNASAADDSTDSEEGDAPVAETASRTPAAKPMPMVAAALAASEAKPRPAYISASVKTPLPPETTVSARGTNMQAVPLDGSTSARPLISTADAKQPAMRWVQGPAGVAAPNAAKPILVADNEDTMPTGSIAPQQASYQAPAKETASRTGWMIQIGAADDMAKANALLSRARSESKGTLGDASPFTEKVQKGGQTLYRARFAGLEENEAVAACKRLKRAGFSCFPTRN